MSIRLNILALFSLARLWIFVQFCRRQKILLGFFINKNEQDIQKLYPEYVFIRLNKFRKLGQKNRAFVEKALSYILSSAAGHSYRFIVWNYRDHLNSLNLEMLATRFSDQAIIRIEIGLIDARCVKTNKVKRFLVDSKAMYFDGRQSTELEDSINGLKVGYRHTQDCYGEMKSEIIAQKMTKFTFSENHHALIPQKNDIIIFGQCVGDMAIQATETLCQTNTELIDHFMNEYQGAGKVFYKSHPRNWCNPSDEEYIARNFPEVVLVAADQHPISLLQHLPTCVVNTSGLGFEALMRGCSVVCYGVSFYSNWGFTQDKINCDRRINRPDFDDFAAFFLLEYTKTAG